GDLIVAQMDLTTNIGSITALGANLKRLWELDDLRYPLAFQPLPDDHVLVVEYAARRVTERTPRDATVWEKETSSPPVAAQRLPDGNTFLACRNQLLEVNAAGKEVFHVKRNVRDVITA